MQTTKKPNIELKRLEKLLNKLLEQTEITKIETRKLNEKIEGTRNWMWIELEKFSDKILDEMALLRNDVANIKDEIITELKTSREEFVAHQGAHFRKQETLDDHEKRIAKLENSPLPSVNPT